MLDPKSSKAVIIPCFTIFDCENDANYNLFIPCNWYEIVFITICTKLIKLYFYAIMASPKIIGMKSSLIYGLFLLVVLPFWLASCQNEKAYQDIKSYYFPAEDLEEGLVYEYRPVNNYSLGPSYWFYKSVITDTALYFTGNFYEADLVVRQFFRAEIVDNGCLMQDYFLYLTDSTGQQTRYDAVVEAPNAFPFMVRDSGGIFLFKLLWTFQKAPLRTTTLIRNRRYIGKDSYNFQGEARECVAFEVKELIDDFDEGHLEQQYSGLELYAKDIGLVYYKKEISTDFVLEYELADIYPMKRLEKRFKQLMTE